MFNVKVILFSILITLGGCSGVSVIGTNNRADLYRPNFLESTSKAQSLYNNGNFKASLKMLVAINEETLMPSEKAFKRNLMGVIFFAEEDYEQAIYQFNQALAFAHLDDSLQAQIYLNIASTYYKLSIPEKAFQMLKLSDYEKLKPKVAEKHHRLMYYLANTQNDFVKAVFASAMLLKDEESLDQLRSSPMYTHLISSFNNLDQSDKFRFIESFEDKMTLAVGYLGYMEAEKLYYQGKKDDGKDLLEWIISEYKSSGELVQLINGFLNRLDTQAKMDNRAIGIVLPLSGKRGKYGKRSLNGIDFAFRKSETRDYKLYIKDSFGSASAGADAVSELIKKNLVSVIIGGLFPKEAVEEYLEAKKHGVFFISLSPIYLPRAQKDHLLLEVPGSVESQLDVIFSDKALEAYGKKAAIIYPNSEKGSAYLEEFWSKARAKGVEVSGVQNYEIGKKKTDAYTKAVKSILGLRFPKQRKEELELVGEIKKLEKSRMRLLNILPPQMDFDWVFLPSRPSHAIQLIPSFKLYDAKRVNMIGSVEWKSKKVVGGDVSKGERLFFAGDTKKVFDQQVLADFRMKYRSNMKVPELTSFEAFLVLDQILKTTSFEDRNDFDIHLRSLSEISSGVSSWKLQEDLWVKKLDLQRIFRKKVIKANLDKMIERRMEKMGRESSELMLEQPSGSNSKE